MKEIRDIINAYDEAEKEGKRSALATVVHVDGSSYRRPGARMLITEDGQLTGAISGGCLEGDALRKALLVMIEQRSMLVTYDTMDEDDAILGTGLGCKGIIQVLIEYVENTDAGNPIQLLKAALANREKAVLVTLYSLVNKKDKQFGTCMLMKEDRSISRHAPVLNDNLINDAQEVLQNQNSSFKNYISENYNLTAFIEMIRPAISLVVFGAGNDVRPMVEMADILGWETNVIDGRPNFAKKERFVSSCRVLLSKPENVFEHLTIDDHTVFVLMTHNYNYDMAILRQLVQKNVLYAGMLGPRKKLERMLEELREEGLHLTDLQLSIIHSPVGLDIGAETPEEIALSILAEIKSIFSKRQGQPLRENTELLHSRHESRIQEVRISGHSK